MCSGWSKTIIAPAAGCGQIRAIESVGNYEEIFERDLGAGSPMKLDRGANRLWTQGGLLYADPVRRGVGAHWSGGCRRRVLSQVPEAGPWDTLHS
jgi:hypothetical protein